jgi:hypothetical protein
MVKETDMISTKYETTTDRPSPFYGWLKSPIAQILILALIVASLPAPAEAAWRDNSGNLPGMVSTGTIVGIAVAGAAAVGLLIYFGKRSKKSMRLKLETPPVKFSEFVSGQPSKRTVAVTNLMSAPVTVKAITIDDKSGAFRIADAREAPFTLAPGEKFQIPLILTATNGSGRAHVRITVTTPKLNKDEIKSIDVSYGEKKSKLRKLIPGK